MADKSIIDNSKLTAIADAIRTKTGGTDALTADQMATEIATLVLPEGTATAANVLKDKTFINSTGKVVTGSMTNRGTKNGTISLETGTYTIQKGYHSGSGKVSLPDGYSLVSNDNTTLDGYSWGSIQALAKKGLLDDLFPIGATKTIYVGGTATTATLIGINQDGSNTATFMFDSPTTYEIHNSGTLPTNGYSATTFATSTADTIKSTLTADLQGVMKTVSKTCNKAGWADQSSISFTADLFIPSVYEITGDTKGYALNGDTTLRTDVIKLGTQYAYFANNGKAVWNTTDNHYPTRNAYTSNRLVYIYKNITSSSTHPNNTTVGLYANKPYGLRLMFVVG